MPPTSILAFIVPKLVIQAENAASDCLYFLISTYPKLAESFLAYVGSAGVDLPKRLEFTTQIVWKHAGGRPDIIGKSGDSAVLVIEAKFDAPLTRRQPIDYIECLPEDRAGVLLFLAPRARIHEIWAQVEKRCYAARIHLGPKTEAADGLSAVPLRGKHRLAIAPWDRLMAVLLRDTSPVSDPIAHADLLQWCALCDRLLSGEIPTAPFERDTLDGDKRDRQLRAMVDRVSAALIKAGHAHTSGYRATPGPGYYKRYMRLSGRGNWCVEFNSEYWARFGESLVWLSNILPSVSSADLAALEGQLGPSIRRLRKGILIPLLAKHARSEGEALEHMIVQATAVANLLASVPPSVTAAAAE